MNPVDQKCKKTGEGHIFNGSDDRRNERKCLLVYNMRDPTSLQRSGESPGSAKVGIKRKEEKEIKEKRGGVDARLCSRRIEKRSMNQFFYSTIVHREDGYG